MKMNLKTIAKSTVLAAVMAACAMPVSAAVRESALVKKETFTPADAAKGQPYMKAAMTVPMADLLKKADIQHPDIMLEYGLGLYLGRDSVSGDMPKDEREKIKATYRGVLDLYLSSSDKFGSVTFDEDAMLDNGDFWVYLAQHVGRPKERQDLRAAIDTAGGGGMQNMFIAPTQQDESSTLNLNVDLILKRPVVNAAITCATSARSFARMKKAQTINVADTKLTPEKYADLKLTAARIYRAAYAVGIQACATRENFMAAADFAALHLGPLGVLKDDPTAVPVEVGDAAAAQ